jgi:GntR family transcriptional regulator of arabinose operon
MEKEDLTRSSSVILYRQLAEVLMQYFQEDKAQVGSRIPTEFELSTKFGVSRGTVRRALRLLEEGGLIERVPGVGTFLRHKVMSSYPTGQRRIGVIVPYAQDQLGLNILVGVESVAKYRGYQVVFSFTNENLEQEKEDIRRMRQDGVCGIIIFPVSRLEYDAAIWQLHQDGFPFVLVDRFFPNLDCDYVVADNFGGGYRATEHLIMLGYKEIAFLCHQPDDFRTTSIRDRYQGYLKALADYHLDFQENWLVMIKDESRASEKDALQFYIEYLQHPDHPKAIFTVNDLTAVSLAAAAGRLGIKLPKELAVVGFDNIKMATQLPCPLTTIQQERTELGVRAAHLLLGRIDGHIGRPEHIVIPTNLVIRESCGARQRIIENRL